MKKMPILLAALFLLAGAGLLFVACGGGGGDPSSPSGGNQSGENPGGEDGGNNGNGEDTDPSGDGGTNTPGGNDSGDDGDTQGGNDTGNNGGGTTLTPGSGGNLLVEKGHAWINQYNNAYLFRADGTYLWLRYSDPIWEKMVGGVYTATGGILTLNYAGSPNLYAYSVTGDSLTLVDERGEVRTFTDRYEYAIDVIYYDGGW